MTMSKAVAMRLAVVIGAAMVSNVQSAACDCFEFWDYSINGSANETYQGCTDTPDWNNTWCYVQGGDACAQAVDSLNPGEERKYRECGSCNCMNTWTYDSDNSPPDEEYEGCSQTPDWNQSWCYVQGPLHCNQAINSTVAGETRKFRECGSCNCMSQWNYDSNNDSIPEVYEGCTDTPDWDQSWCYVEGGSNCNQYINSTVPGETRKFRECGSCNCLTEWNYDADGNGSKPYEGCTTTPDWNQSWCYVQGGSNCNQALDSTVDGETRKYRQCGSCNCMSSWNYDDGNGSKPYEGCSTSMDFNGGNTEWCYVQGGSNCEESSVSEVPGEKRQYRECSACNCMTEWNYDSTGDGEMEVFEGCSTSMDFNQGTTPWCYVQGGSNCDDYQNSTVPGEERKYITGCYQPGQCVEVSSIVAESVKDVMPGYRARLCV